MLPPVCERLSLTSVANLHRFDQQRHDFADLPKVVATILEMAALFGGHILDRVSKEHGIQHKLTKPYHPWTNSQMGRMH